MRQQAFEQEYRPVWQEFDNLMQDLAGKGSGKGVVQHYRLPHLYRQICHHYAMARERYYSPHLIASLHRRILTGHQFLYRYKSSWLWRILKFILAGFPQQVRRHAKYFYLSMALFITPLVVMGLACYLDSELIYSILPANAVAQIEYTYNPANEKIGRSADRQSDTSFMMFGYYIFNNISIGFRSYAMGILLGIGTVFMVLYNGMIIGGIAGYLTRFGYIETFWPFVSGHSAFELTAIVICGAAGLRLAQPIIAPGRYSRSDALKLAGKESIELVLGAALMLVVAAFIEAFWSPSTWTSITVKYIVAGFFWLTVILYLSLAGKKADAD